MSGGGGGSSSSILLLPGRPWPLPAAAASTPGPGTRRPASQAPTPTRPPHLPRSYNNARTADMFLSYLKEQVNKDGGFARVDALDAIAAKFTEADDKATIVAELKEKVRRRWVLGWLAGRCGVVGQPPARAASCPVPARRVHPALC